jgi:hypothetical protein
VLPLQRLRNADQLAGNLVTLDQGGLGIPSATEGRPPHPACQTMKLGDLVLQTHVGSAMRRTSTIAAHAGP